MNENEMPEADPDDIKSLIECLNALHNSMNQQTPTQFKQKSYFVENDGLLFLLKLLDFIPERQHSEIISWILKIIN